MVVCRDTFIYKVWVNEVAAANSPFSPHHIPGRYVWDFLEPSEADIIAACIQDVICQKMPVIRTVTLTVPVEHKQRLVRFLPLNNDAALVYLVKLDTSTG